VFDGHYPILIVPRHIGMASTKKALRVNEKDIITIML